MAHPLFALLTPRVRALLPIILGGVGRGLSINAVNAVIKAAQGRGIRKQVLADVMRVYRSIKSAGPKLKNLNLKAIPNIARLPRALTGLKRKLAFGVLVKGIDLNSGLNIDQWVTVSIDDAMSREQIESAAEDAIYLNRDNYSIEITSSMIEWGMRAGEMGII